MEVSGMRKIQLLENLSSNIDDNFTEDTILFADPENSGQTRGVFIKKLFSEDFDMKYSRNDLCFCGSGKKQKKCHPDINEKSVIANLLTVFNRLNNEMSECKFSVCSKGCAECCSDDFGVSISEFFVILNYMKINFTSEHIKSILELAKLSSDKDTISISSRCIFLNATDNSCDVYEVRPIICRMFGTYKNKTYCHKISENKKANDNLLITNTDTTQNINEFKSGGKILYSAKKPIVYWLSRYDGDKFSSDKLNKLYFAAFHRTINEYIQILKL